MKNSSSSKKKKKDEEEKQSSSQTSTSTTKKAATTKVTATSDTKTSSTTSKTSANKSTGSTTGNKTKASSTSSSTKVNTKRDESNMTNSEREEKARKEAQQKAESIPTLEEKANSQTQAEKDARNGSKQIQIASGTDAIKNMSDAGKDDMLDYLYNKEGKYTKSEEKYVNALYKDYKKNRQTDDLVNGGTEGYLRGQKYNTTASRTNNLNTLVNSFAEAIPGVKQGIKAIDKYNANNSDNTTSAYDELQRANEQSPIASAVGNMASKVAQFYDATELMKGIPVLSGIGEGVSQGLGAVGEDLALNGSGVAGSVGSALAKGGATTIGNMAQGIVNNQLAQTALEVLPNAIDNARNGQSAKEVLKNAAEEEGKDLLMNTLFEGAGYGIKKGASAIKTSAEAKQAARAAEQAASDARISDFTDWLNGSNRTTIANENAAAEAKRIAEEEAQSAAERQTRLAEESAASAVQKQKTAQGIAERLSNGTATNNDMAIARTDDTVREYINSVFGTDITGTDGTTDRAILESLKKNANFSETDRAISSFNKPEAEEIIPELSPVDEYLSDVNQIAPTHNTPEIGPPAWTSRDYDRLLEGTKNDALPGFTNEEAQAIQDYTTRQDALRTGVGEDTEEPLVDNFLSTYERNAETAKVEGAQKVQNTLNTLNTKREQLIDKYADAIVKGDGSDDAVLAQINKIDKQIENLNKFSNKTSSVTSTTVPTETTPSVPTDVPTDVPTTTNASKDMAVSKMATEGTYVKSGITTEEQRNRRKYQELMQYAVDHKDTTMDEAVKRISAPNGLEEWEEKLANENVSQYTPTDVHTAFMVYTDLTEKAVAAEKAGLTEEAEALWKRSDRIASQAQKITTSSAKEMNAVKEWAKNTPEGAVVQAKQALRSNAVKKLGAETVDRIESNVNDISKQLANSTGSREDIATIVKNEYGKSNWKSMSGKSKVVDLINNFDFENGNVDDLIEDIQSTILKQNGIANISWKKTREVYSYVQKALDAGDPNSYESRKAMAQAAKIITDEMPASWGQMLKSITYANMLGNFKTAVSRNLGGNIGFNTIEGLLTKPLSAGIDRATSLLTKERSIPDPSMNRLSASVEGAKKGVADQARDFVSGLSTVRSGQENTLENAIDLNKRAFTKTEIPVLKQISNALNRTSKGVTQAMEFGDRPVYETIFNSQKQGYENLVEQLKEKWGSEWANHLAGFNPEEESIEEFIEYSAAKDMAEQGIFQDDSLVSQGLQSFKNGLSKVSKGIAGTDVMSQPSMAFTKTPGSIIERWAEYSPIGFLKNAIETATEIASKGKTFDQKRFATELSRSIVGTGLEAGSVMAAIAGLTTDGYSDDDDKKAAEYASGKQEYALNIGGKQYDSSDIPVLGQSIESGAKANERIQEKAKEQGLDGITFDDLKDPEILKTVLKEIFSLETAKDTVGSGFQSSALQGMNKLFGTTYSKSGDNFMDNVENTIKSSGSQWIPSLMRQTAQTTDDYKRDYGEYGTNEYYWNMMQANIPGSHKIGDFEFGRETLPIKYDNEGNPVLQNQGRGLGSKIVENYLLPMTETEYSPSRLTQAGDEIYDATGKATAYAPMESRSDVKSFCEKYGIEYSENLYQQWKQERGSMNTEIGNALLDSEAYSELTPEEQADLFSKLYSTAGDIEKAALTADAETTYTSDNKYTKMYANGSSMDDIIAEYKKSNIYKEADVSSSTTLDSIYDEAMASGGEDAAIEAVQNYSEVQSYLKDELGFSTSSTGYKELITSSTVEEAKQNYSELVANGTITKDGKKGTKSNEQVATENGYEYSDELQTAFDDRGFSDNDVQTLYSTANEYDLKIDQKSMDVYANLGTEGLELYASCAVNDKGNRTLETITQSLYDEGVDEEEIGLILYSAIQDPPKGIAEEIENQDFAAIAQHYKKKYYKE